MSKAIYITYKEEINKSDFKNIEERIKHIEKKIIPDNITPNPVNIKRDNNTITAVFNPVSTVKQSESSLCLGYVQNEEWDDVNSKSTKLEGTFAIFRKGQNKVQLITDWVGSRTIWYYFDKEKLIASTSQLAIIYYLNTFEFNQEIIPWILSSGTLGPFFSWDKRIKAQKPKTVLTLNIKEWEIQKKSSEIVFKSNIKNKNQKRDLIKALNQVFKNLNVDFKKWILPLSGGYDSRGILLFLRKNGYKDIKTLTWGAEESQYIKDNDAYIAKKLAKHCKVSHQYVLTNETNEPVEKIVHRFLVNGEGRIDHISGYMDGFEIWKSIFKKKYLGIIRGDEGFGWQRIYSSEYAARSSVGLNLMSDYANLNEVMSEFNFKQELPGFLKNKENETFEQYRDRLYHTFRLPLIMASLSDLKLNYTEIINPLLFPSILKEVYVISDKWRSNKKMFREIVEESLPNFPFAKEGANILQQDLLKTEEFAQYLKLEIPKGKDVFSKDFLNKIRADIQVKTNRSKNKPLVSKIKTAIAKRLPSNAKQYIKLKGANNIDPNLLAFRVLIIIKMNEIIKMNIDPNF